MQKKAFTLIELLVVIAIIGILSGIVLTSLRGARNRAYDAEVKLEISQIRNEAEVYYNGTSSYQGFTVPANFDPPACSKAAGTQTYQLSFSPDYQSIAIYAKLCTDTTKYWCADSSGKTEETTQVATDGNCP